MRIIMKKLLFLILFTIFGFAKMPVVVSVVPEKIFVEKIGGDYVEVSVMIPVGSSPHTYEPKTSQMIKVSKAQLYFSIGLEFEEVWLDKFANQNKTLKIIDISNDINKSISVEHHGEKELDPHIWVDPINVKQIAVNITKALSLEDKSHTAYYEKNLKIFLKELDALDAKIQSILKKTAKETNFMVFHPAWGYFAKRYKLKQLAVEIEGKEPKMRALIQLIKKAKKEKVQAIFTQPEFSDKSAKIIAKDLNIAVIKASPLSQNWSETLIELAKAIAHKKS